jgi:hypothetical protein
MKIPLLAAILIASASASAQNNPLDSGPNPLDAGNAPVANLAPPPDTDLISMVYPNVAAMPAPVAIRPGFRMTYLHSTGSSEGDGELVEDPNGNIEDKVTKKRYRREPPKNLIGAAGAQWVFLEVAAVAGNTAVLAQRTYQYDNLHGNLWPGSSWAAAIPAGMNEFWVNPAAIDHLVSQSAPTVNIRRMPYAMETGAQFDAIRFTVETGEGYTAHTYDAKTGVLLRRIVVTRKGGFTIDGQPYQGRSSVAVTTLYDMHQMQLPWLGEANPDWIRNVRKFHIRGAGQRLLVGSDIQTPDSQIVGEFAITERGDGWLRGRTRSQESASWMAPQEQDFIWISGQGSLGSYFLPPAGLQKLQNNQVLDRCRATNVVMQVTFIGNAPDGASVACISEIANKTRRDYVYDTQSGMLKRVIVSWDLDASKESKTWDIVGTE